MDTTCQAALERLDAALDPGEFATTLTSSPGRLCLSVTSRHAAIGDDIIGRSPGLLLLLGGMDRAHE